LEIEEHLKNIVQRFVLDGSGDMAVVTRIRRYLAQTGTAQTMFGRAAMNDPRLVDDLLNGRQPGPRTVARIDAFIASHPEGL
jgi:tRNA-dihydrouridine synthase